MPAKLICKTGQLAGADYEIAQEALIGTAAENDIVLFPKVVSGKHARIFYAAAEGCYYLEDLASRNGTQLDGLPVKQKEKLGRLHVITLAGLDFIFHEVRPSRAKTLAPRPEKQSDKSSSDTQLKTVLGDDFKGIPAHLVEPDMSQDPGKEKAKTKLDERAQAMPKIPDIPEIPDKPFPQKSEGGPAKTVVQPTPGKPAPDKFRQVANEDQADKNKTVLDDRPPPIFAAKVSGSHELIVEKVEKSFNLKDGENIVGRTIECDIFIDDPSVSRQHAVLYVRSDGVKLKDLDSKNHTFVEGVRVESEVNLRVGAKIRFGDVDTRLQKSQSGT